MKIVINRDYGGFGLSVEATREYLSRKYGNNWGESEPDKYGFIHFYVTNDPSQDGKYFHEHDIPRDDKVLVEVVETLTSEKASGRYACLKVVEVPENVEWYIEEYDGMEHVAEHHRTWA